MDGRHRRPWASLACGVAIIVAFVVEMGMAGWKFVPFAMNPMLGPDTQVLRDAGAKDTKLIKSGEWWRLITPMLLHAGVIHLAMNVVGLALLSPPLERQLGARRTAVLLVGAGIFSSLCSAFFLPATLSVGASGALFGVFGGMFAFLLLRRDDLADPQRFLRFLCVNLLVSVLVGLTPYLDQWAHLGGLGSGFAIGLLLVRRPFQYGERRDGLRKKLCVALPLAFLCGSTVALVLGLAMDLDVDQTCGDFCRYLNCVPLPWWDCDREIGGFECTGTLTRAAGDNPAVLTVNCPDGTEASCLAEECLHGGSAEEFTITLCREVCDF